MTFWNVYRDRRVLVTGHTGFKGSWLAIWLERLGARVVGYALEPPTEPSIFALASLERRLSHVPADIRDGERMAEAVASHRPDVVFHLAASPLVRASYGSPRETFDTNVMGTISLLEAIRRAGRPCAVVIVSTDKCYENREWEYGYREADPVGGHDPYSASKGAMEVAVASWRRSFFGDGQVRLASARAGNVIGGGDWAADRIVPDLVRALSAHAPARIRNPDAVRPWQHVLEPLSGYLTLGAALSRPDGARFAGAWNFGPSPTELHTVGALADAVVSAWGAGTWQAAREEAAPHEAATLRLAIDKAQAHLGWRPSWSFEETVRRTVAWYQRVAASSGKAACALEACIDDIAAYEEAAATATLVWTT